MPGSYDTPNDGKLYTRYSELARCSVKGAVLVAQERLLNRDRLGDDGSVKFGRIRHEMFAKESNATGKTPECFLEPPCSFEMPVDFVEKEFRCEPIPNIVLCSTPDAVCLEGKTVIDYKTTQGSLFNFANHKQIMVYAFNLALNNYVIRNGVYLCEVWSPDRSRVIGYGKVEQQFTISDLHKIFNTFLKPRMLILQEAIKQVEKQR